MARFRTKARALDLLGKGQIADLPTAISELWKNGYDAYADNLEAFVYEELNSHKESVFIISDDGKGMNRDEIIDKWFVLGTDSKSRNESEVESEETLWKIPRIKMGEKGIGRLAVAYLGPQMLMLTKKRKFPLEVVFFDWRILENYNLFLEHINIPVRMIENLSDFESSFLELKEDFLRNFKQEIGKDEDPWSEQMELKTLIETEIKNLKCPDFLINNFAKELLINPTQTNGTKFIIFKPESQILDLKNFIKTDEDEDYRDDLSVNHTISALAGLFNLFKTDDPPYKTKFWIVNDDGKYDLLNTRAFFTPTDFEDCDHLIEGEFDKFGTFNGNVRIYNQPVSHTFSPLKKRQETNYGSFKIKLGYVQFSEEGSKVKDERKRLFEQKLELYSGLFIYRDGFRVLPYGRPDTDFLEFEERRSRHAGTYFFSKRRMFGYIEISRKENEKLKDKSSREGFINNAAYRDFRTDLISFFKDLAKKYFATKAEFDYKKTQQEELEKQAQIAEQERQRDIEERKKFAQQLKILPNQLEGLKKEYNELLKKLESKTLESEISYNEIQTLLSDLDKCKIKYAEYKLAKPVRYKPTPLQKTNFKAYQDQYELFSQLINNSSTVIKKVRTKLKVHELFQEFESKNQLFQNSLVSQFSQYEENLNLTFEKIRRQISNEKTFFISEFSNKYSEIIPRRDDANAISDSLALLEGLFREAKERLTNRIEPFLKHLERVSLEVNEDDLVGYFKDQFEEMKKEWEQTYELAQLGIAVEIIDHQFNALYSQLAENIKSLNGHLKQGEDSKIKYDLLLNSFNHLEDNYQLLQPLYRTTGRIRKNVTASELFDYAKEFFRERLDKNKIKLEISDAAKKWTVFSYESIFKPVVINIINNAIFWLQPVENRVIRFDVIDNLLLIMNSGVPMDDSVLEDIFNLFFSERPKGRGIGLYLAKKSLNGIGFDIRATNDNTLNLLKGACFVISQN